MEDLTAEQRVVAARPVHSQTFVVAGPGTGKTHVLAARVATLLDRDDVGETRTILVVSFTRAAVAELRTRVGVHDLGRGVAATTIDAFARRIVRERGEDASVEFDAVVKRATEILEDPSTDRRFDHVVVDEAQDLGRLRLDFITAVFARADGFTVLGDPAQGIYGFRQAGGPADAMAELGARFPGAITLGLSIEHRVRSAGAALVSWAREDLLTGQSAELGQAMRLALREAPHVSERSLALVLRHADSRTAVICRNNGDVLALSQNLRGAGVDHRIQPSADVSVPPRWIAGMLAGVVSDRIDYKEFAEIGGPLSLLERPSAWAELIRVAGEADGSLSLESLRHNLNRLGSLGTPRDRPVLSTVHRVKGLEFDRVLVQEFPDVVEGRDDVAEEARVLFVAMTRSREETLMVERAKPLGPVRRRAGRWFATPWRRDTPTSVEVRTGDVDRLTPLQDGGSAAYVQRHLAGRVLPGDAVSLERRQSYGQTTYVVTHRGVAVGAMSTAFVSAIDRLGANPGAVTELVVDEVSTASGDPEVTIASDIGDGGFWLVPEISGFGRLR